MRRTNEQPGRGRRRGLYTALLAIVAATALSGVARDALAHPGSVSVSTNRNAACTVGQPQDPAFHNSFASAFRCRRDLVNGAYVGETHGVAAIFRTANATNKDSGCDASFFGGTYELGYLNCRPNTRASVTMQLRNQFYAQGQERITAAVNWSTPNSSIEFYFGVQHDGTGSRYALATAQLRDDVYKGPLPVSIYITPSSTAGRYDICYGRGANYGCEHRTTNVGLFSGVSAEQFVSNDHQSVFGSSRHRARAYSLYSQSRYNGGWYLWPASETGVSAGGYAAVESPSGYDRCLRTGDLSPNCS